MSWLDSLEEIRKTDWSKVAGPERQVKAREVVNISAYAAAATAVVPVPLADLALLLPVHSAMVMTVGHIYHRKLSGAEAKRVVLELGAIAGLTFAGRAAITALLKLLPGIGGLLSVPATFALTWGLGRVAIEYFANPSLSRDDLRKVFHDAVQEGKSVFSKEAFDRFWQKNGGAERPPAGRAPDEPKASSDVDWANESNEPANGPTTEPGPGAHETPPRDPKADPSEPKKVDTLRPKKRTL